MTDVSPSSESPGITWPVIAAISIATTVYFSQARPIRSTRPLPEPVRAQQNVSWLWDDPLAWEEGESEPDDLDSLAGSKILCVCVSEENGPEAREQRRRTRHALHCAASSLRWEPDTDGGPRFVKLETGIRALLSEGAAARIERFTKRAEDSGALESLIAVWCTDDSIERLGELAERGAHGLDLCIVGPETTRQAQKYECLLASTSIPIFSPWVTSGALDEIEKAAGDGHKQHGFERFIAKDADVASLLSNELRLRDVSAPEQVLLILERDTAYSREWANHLATAWSDDQDGAAAPHDFHTYYYSRGLDGDQRHNSAGKPDPVALDQPHGRPRADYLRRLHENLRTRSDLNGIRGVGIFGTDIHDKLLVLQALRDTFPHAVYFTSDLDAAMFDPRWIHVTRNMIVGSGGSLTPDALQRASHDASACEDPGINLIMPPFRDTYQTCAFRAFQAAINAPARVSATQSDGQASATGLAEGDYADDAKNPIEATSTPSPERGRTANEPSIFEIGTRRAVPLRPTESMSLSTWALTLLALLSAWLVPWFVLRLLRRGSNNDSEASSESRRELPWQRPTWQVLLALGVLPTLLLVLGLASSEPLSWSDGISVWPTEIMRVLAINLTAVYFVHTLAATMTSSANIRKSGGSPKPLLLRVINKDPAEDDEQTFFRWIAYGAIAIGLLTTVAIGATVWLIEWPHPPVRGGLMLWIDRALTGLCAWSLLTLVFLLIEFACLHAAWCRHATKTVDEQVKDRVMRKRLDDVATAGGNGLHGPFVVILILCIARIWQFDDWAWPITIQIGTLACASLVVIAHWNLHQQAIRLKDACIKRIKDHLFAQETTPDDRGVYALKLEDFKGMRHGILAGPANHPVLRALVIPFSGIGGISLLQWSQFL